MTPHLRAFLRRQLPVATVLCAVLLDLAPLPFVDERLPTPLLTPPVVLYWLLHRPDVTTPLSLVVAGLVFDALGGLPLGASGLALLAMAAPVYGRERAVLGQPVLLLWGTAAFALFLFFAVRWLALVFWYGRGVPATPLFGDYLFTLLLLPAVWRLLAPLLRRSGGERGAQPA